MNWVVSHLFSQPVRLLARQSVCRLFGRSFCHSVRSVVFNLGYAYPPGVREDVLGGT
jgi:hypothetical protein